MRKLAEKIAVFAGFTAAILVFSACMEPPNLSKFFDDEKVTEKIERDRVTLIDKTGESLRRGNKTISGLNPNRYYVVLVEAEESDTEAIPEELGTFYVGKDGRLKNKLIDMDRAQSSMIVNLNNQYIYTVWVSKPLTGSLKRYDISNLSALDNTPPPAPVSHTANNNGAVTVPSPADQNFIDVGSLITADINYTILRVPVSDEDGFKNTSLLLQHPSNTGRFIQLSRAYTITDYVLIGYNDDDEPDLRLLRVTLQGELKEDGLTFDVEYNLPGLNLPVVTASALSHNQGSGSITFTVTNASDFHTPFRWSVDGKEDTSQTSGTYTMTFNDINMDYKIEGVYRITVIAQHKNDNAWYSATVEITVSR